MVEHPTYPAKSYQVVEYEIPKEIVIFNRLSSVIFNHDRQFRNPSRVFKETKITMRFSSQNDKKLTRERIKRVTFLRF